MKSYAALLSLLLVLGAGLHTAGQSEIFEDIGLGQEQYDYDDAGAADDDEKGGKHEVPSFNVQPMVFNPTVGETVNIPCTSGTKYDSALLMKRRYFDDSKAEQLISGDTFFFVKDDRYSIQDNVFTITNVRKSDSGYYSCTYQTPDMNINVTHTLDVYFSATVKPEHKIIEAIKGDKADLDCNADGNPKPTITWTKQGGKMPSGEAQERGTSIIFEEVDRHVHGTYECLAQNGVGEPAKGTREVVVFYPPEIRTEKEIVHTGNGDKVELVCVVHANPAAEVQWTHDNKPVDRDTMAEVHEGGHRHLLTIEQVSEADFGVYQCSASNKYGAVFEEIKLTDAPSAPAITSDPHSAEESSYTLTWTTESYYPITAYTITYRKTKANESTDEPGEWMEIAEDVAEGAQDAGPSRSFERTVADLERATDYDGVLVIRNSVKPSADVTFNFSTRKALPPTSLIQLGDNKDALAGMDKAGGHRHPNAAASASLSASLLSLCLFRLLSIASQ
ncbi:protein amalgam isoform X2 [Hyalella azteca]|uniref:Protein amalgam isoform X2 n=1 Tax=Hyalella azteca TaxID=294128 RepID=A0A979FUC3_HYAAZ|nr:protein amalgam isoform X2 [Hyalella azteca]